MIHRVKSVLSAIACAIVFLRLPNFIFAVLLIINILHVHSRVNCVTNRIVSKCKCLKLNV